MRRQPEPIYATLLGTFQQAMEHICSEELVNGKKLLQLGRSRCAEE